ncbi:cupin domain-containing protein [Parvularcula sp. ZS-1/3]|uniref:Cupin domain-containing protein n=1 Tax=Parvularcula mediterranea TaxID=2732508 RepID=A0A7Y3RMQ8_9PROT|nr:cupin domain-containing protein [Parvularcula mediterranea]NNU16937.1 cupin domain-containing protein [Parvularcula mediterranea]
MATIEKLNASEHHPGSHGEALAMTNGDMAMRVWNEGKVEKSDLHASDYETIGYVIDGTAILHSEEGPLHLTKGDSWRVPKGVMHGYEIETSFRAVEVTSPPARGAALGATNATSVN